MHTAAADPTLQAYKAVTVVTLRQVDCFVSVPAQCCET